MEHEHYITVKDASINLKLSKQSVRKLIRDQELEAIKIHREYRINVASYRAWLRTHTVNRSNQ